MKTTFSFKRFEKTETIEIDFEKLPAASIAYLLNYGAKQSLSDAFAGAKDADEFQAKLGQRLDALLAGTMGVNRASPIRDPFEAECMKIARERIEEALRTRNVKVDKEKKAALVAEYRKSQAAKIEAEAKRRLASKKDASDEFDSLFAGIEEPEEESEEETSETEE